MTESKQKDNPEINLSWADIHLRMNQLATALGFWKLQRAKPCIVAIGRGGLAPAVILSNMLGVPIAHVVFVKTYKGKENVGAKLTELGAIPQKMVKDCIFVDDLVDTGSTFEAVKAKYPDAKFVTPYAKIEGFNKYKNDFLFEPPVIYEQNSWLVFPWERSWSH